jgi:hypothetical protein
MDGKVRPGRRRLRGLIDRLRAAGKADPKNWGRVGDLGKVRSDLIEIVAFLSSVDREQIETFLAE